jgi:hypothetical protein
MPSGMVADAEGAPAEWQAYFASNGEELAAVRAGSRIVAMSFPVPAGLIS